MKVVLMDDVAGLGDIGETVNVKPGYARNFLVPRGFAMEAESASARVMAHRMKQVQAKSKRLKAAAEERSSKLQSLKIEIELRVGMHGRVFGSVTARDIAEKLTQQNFEVDRRRVLLAEPIKKIGEHAVRVKLHQEVESTVTVVIVPKEASEDDEQRAAQNAKALIEQRSAEKQAGAEGDAKGAGPAEAASEQ